MLEKGLERGEGVPTAVGKIWENGRGGRREKGTTT